jgi:hypothetical protein
MEFRMSSRTRRIVVVFVSVFGLASSALAAEGRPPVELDGESAVGGRDVGSARVQLGADEAGPHPTVTRLHAPNASGVTDGEYIVVLPFILNAQQAAKPVITSFGASPTSIAKGGQTTLSWVVSGATSLSISPGLGTVSGASVTVTPATTTEYTLTASNAAGSTSARTTIVVSEGDQDEPGALFLNRSDKTNSAAIAIDANNGIHVAYAAFNRNANGEEPAYYAYCAASCASTSSWAAAKLGDRVQEVQLALDPAGRPRMLIRMRDQNLDTFYQYAACDADCTSTASWQIATVTPTSNLDTSLWDYSQHYFALDPQGRPRFVYYDELNAPHNGTFYVFCDTNCTNAANWREIKLSDNAFTDASLTFTSAGQPRFVAVGIPSSTNESALAYILCDAACDNPQNWGGAYLYERGGGHASFVLRLDSNDRPRIAFYQGSLSNGLGHRLHYVWCDHNCANGQSWEGTSVGLETLDGQDPDLALDAQSQPRIAYRNVLGDSLAYAWCDAVCTSATASWQQRVVEPSSVLDAAWPIPPPANCTRAFWFGGFRPSLALDGAGKPRIAYDAEHMHSGGRCSGVTTDFKAVRIVW